MHNDENKQGTRLITTDTDWFMAHTYQVWPRVIPVLKTAPLFWDNDDNVPGLDLPALAKSLRAAHFSRDAFMIKGILSGCDYMKKNMATNGVGRESIYRGIIEYMRVSRPGKGKPREYAYTLGGFYVILQHIYAHMLKCDPAAVAASKSKRKNKLLLTPEAAHDAFVTARLTFDYYTRKVCWDPDKDPAKRGIVATVYQRIDAMQIQFKPVVIVLDSEEKKD